ncbi:Biotin-requiring enzyme [Carnobacterium iners]|uniref:Biotin-requiring enzyme n=1 Tax=Carnobacterium iners TaxID=1073423 RepID=A0A1X7MSK7_9LACT|nr:biotin/lipoyl-containing protein [Carnobacterium iners]SEL14929.1 Biotin-requiring enzyme [Carnobacterium iners]SMH27321.1 Biotin-requiring enzyme [Carnobacterium iners]
MKTYEVTVNNKVYQVSVEEVNEADSKNKAIALDNENKKEEPVKTPVLSGIEVKAPMPGTIISVLVQLGETIKAGQVLCVLEAMKMENEIVAPEDGTIQEVMVSKGMAVEAGASLVRL